VDDSSELYISQCRDNDESPAPFHGTLNRVAAFASVRAITIRDHRAQSSCISNEVRRVRRLAELDHVECRLPDISGRFPSGGDTVVSADAVDARTASQRRENLFRFRHRVFSLPQDLIRSLGTRPRNNTNPSALTVVGVRWSTCC